MRFTQLFTKTLKETPKEAENVSSTFLIRAGFIDRPIASGIYSFLPLGWRVFKKIEAIIREEMNALGAQELYLPTLIPKNLWEKTDRWSKMEPPLFKLKDRHQKEFGLGSTHEEVITDIASRFISSYKDLPVALYQIQNKFRNELRSTGGLLRVREFIMKDLYSFHKDEKDLDRFYKKVCNAYLKIFKRCGFKVKIVEAVGGAIGGKVTHEFMMLCETGEDRIFYCLNCGWAANIEVVGNIQKCPRCGGKIQEARAIENGHTFKLGEKYSKAFNLKYKDKDGKEKTVLMGCYGIGLGRLMATVVEANHDDKGIRWPLSIAPFHVYLIDLASKKKELGEALYKDLQKEGIEVLFDDREDISPGEKFADADLIGIPYRLVLSKKTLEKKSVEVKERSKKQARLVLLKQITSYLKAVLKSN